MCHAFGIPALTKSRFGKNQSYEVLTPDGRFNKRPHNYLGKIILKLETPEGHILTVQNDFFFFFKKAKIFYKKAREYNHILQTTPRHREEEPQNTDCHKTSGRQLK